MLEKAVTEEQEEHVGIACDVAPLQNGSFDFQFDAKMDRTTVMRLDLLLQPILFITFVFVLLDRANVGNARVAGMQLDLGLTDHEYQIGLVVTFIPYILIEIPSNFVLKKIGPRWMLPVLCMSWGLVCTLESQIQSYAGFIACRFFIGLCEGGLFPGYVLVLSEFYRRDEIQKRIGLLYGAASIAGAFGGLLAAAIEQMDGVASLAGWRWIFLLEGLATVVFGFATLWVMPSTPRDVLTFTEEQKNYYVKRIAADQKTTEDGKVSLRDVIACLRDPHVINILILSFAISVVAQGFAYFTPSVVLTFGYSSTITQLLTVPLFMFAFVTTMIAGVVSDHYHQRGMVAIVTAGLGIVGCILNFTGTSLKIRYTALFFLIGGVYASTPSVLAWIPNNTAPYGKRAAVVALGFMVANSGGILGIWIYPTKDAPRYLPANSANTACLAITVVLSLVQVFYLKHLNKCKISKRDELLSGVEQVPSEDQIKRLGDHHPDFVYVL